ncbi:thioesterase family protein [Fodinicola acaciae]|uniref:thioesterase family protein n=1 Tax=Fodinicola acaciae TaxID=2681555 RepID=UPI0013CFCA83|nr:acyl-CoA thioesterase [Fodinicola acaciae]
MVTIAVRLWDLDTNGHVRGSAYLDYADHARWECVRAAGVSLDALAEARVGPVNLETTVRFQHELRAGDEVHIATAFSYGSGKTSRVSQRFTLADGTAVAEVSSVGGLLDLRTRRLLPDPASHWRALAAAPHHLGL